MFIMSVIEGLWSSVGSSSQRLMGGGEEWKVRYLILVLTTSSTHCSVLLLGDGLIIRHSIIHIISSSFSTTDCNVGLIACCLDIISSLIVGYYIVGFITCCVEIFRTSVLYHTKSMKNNLAQCLALTHLRRLPWMH